MSGYTLITLNMTAYADVYLKKQSAEYARIILTMSNAVHKVAEFTEQLLRQTYSQHCQAFR